MDANSGGLGLTRLRHAGLAVLCLAAMVSGTAFAAVDSCPSSFAALRPLVEEVRNPTVRASALDMLQQNVAQAVYRAGGLQHFVARQQALIDEWRSFPAHEFFEPDRQAMIGVYQRMVDIAQCVPRKGDPRVRVDRSAPDASAFNAVAAIRGPAGRNGGFSFGSGVLVSPCHVLTSYHVVFGDGPPKSGQAVGVMMGEAENDQRAELGFATRVAATVVGYSRRYWAEPSVGDDWVVLRLAQRMDDRYPAMSLPPRDAAPISAAQFARSGRALTVAGFPGEKMVEGGGLSALWRHDGCHVLASQSPSGGWATTCAMNPGQSGGPVVTASEDAHWILVGLATAMSTTTLGVVAPDEQDVLRANLMTPLQGETLEEIYQSIDAYACDR